MILARAKGLVEFASVANVIVHLPSHSDAFLYIFLPLLVFEAGLNIEVRRMIEDATSILMLAVVAVLVSTLFIGRLVVGALRWLLDMRLAQVTLTLELPYLA